MATPGQPTLYKPEYCELAHNYCLPGATNEVLANSFGVAPRTVDNFADAVKRGRAAAETGTDRLLLRFEKALLPVTVISYPCHGTQKFVLLRAGPTGRERCGESMRHAGD